MNGTGRHTSRAEAKPAESERAGRQPEPGGRRSLLGSIAGAGNPAASRGAKSSGVALGVVAWVMISPGGWSRFGATRPKPRAICNLYSAAPLSHIPGATRPVPGRGGAIAYGAFSPSPPSYGARVGVRGLSAIVYRVESPLIPTFSP